MGSGLNALRVGEQLKSHEQISGIGHVANEPSQRQREFLNECGRGDDLTISRQARLLVNVNHFKLVSTLQMLLTQAPEIGYCASRAGRNPGYIETH